MVTAFGTRETNQPRSQLLSWPRYERQRSLEWYVTTPTVWCSYREMLSYKEPAAMEATLLLTVITCLSSNWTRLKKVRVFLIYELVLCKNGSPCSVFFGEVTKEFDGQQMQCTSEHNFLTFISSQHLFLLKKNLWTSSERFKGSIFLMNFTSPNNLTLASRTVL